MAKYGTIYAELDLDKKWSLLFNVMFVIRRFLFALSTILMGQWVTFQLQVQFVSSLIIIVYVQLWEPFKERKMIWIETMNEVTEIFLLYNL